MDEVPRFVGMPVDVDGCAGIKILGPVGDDNADQAVEDKGKKSVAVELGRGWIE